MVVHQGLFAVLGPFQGDTAQILAVRTGGDDIGAAHNNGLVQGAVGVAGDDQVDPRHFFGKLLILRGAPLVAGAAVGQRNDELGALLLHGVHAPLGGFRRVLQHKAGGGGAVVGVRSHQAENAVRHVAPLQQHILPHAAGGHCPLDVQPVGVIRGGLVVCHQQGGQLVAAGRRGLEHLGKAGPLVVKLVVSHGHRVIAHGAHGPQLRGLGGVESLNQGPDGEISPVHQQRPGIFGLLLVNGGFQPGVSPRFPALAVHLGQEVGVQVVGKQNGRGFGAALRPRGGQDHNQQQSQKDGQQTDGALFHETALLPSGRAGRSGAPGRPVLQIFIDITDIADIFHITSFQAPGRWHGPVPR